MERRRSSQTTISVRHMPLTHQDRKVNDGADEVLTVNLL